MKIEMRKLTDIIPYDKNPRMNESAVDAVAASIKEFGFRQPIVIDESSVIIVGHTRYKAAVKLGLDKVPCHIAVGLTPAQAKAYRIADNQTATKSEWDESLLAEELKALEAMDFNLDLLGFDEKETERIFSEQQEKMSSEIPDIPAYLTFIVTPEQRAEIELSLDAQEGENRTEQLLCLIRKA